MKDITQEAGVLRVLNQLGGKATVAEIGKHWKHPDETQINGNQPITWRLHALIKHGRVVNTKVRVSRGEVYQITDKGKRFLESISRIQEKV